MRESLIMRSVVALALCVALGLPGCRQYDVQGSQLRGKTPVDPHANAARRRLKPGLRSGVSEASQDIERSLGY